MSLVLPTCSRLLKRVARHVILRPTQLLVPAAAIRAIPTRLAISKHYATNNSTTTTSSALPSLEPPTYLDERELHIFNTIKAELSPSSLEVQDISGGCGSMYALDIVSEKFRGLPVIKQHRLVNSVLGEEIKKWHGVQLKTRAP